MLDLPLSPGARYAHSLRLLAHAKRLAPGTFTKSGIMVGLGESEAEVLHVMDDMPEAQRKAFAAYIDLLEQIVAQTKLK